MTTRNSGWNDLACGLSRVQEETLRAREIDVRGSRAGSALTPASSFDPTIRGSDSHAAHAYSSTWLRLRRRRRRRRRRHRCRCRRRRRRHRYRRRPRRLPRACLARSVSSYCDSLRVRSRMYMCTPVHSRVVLHPPNRHPRERRKERERERERERDSAPAAASPSRERGETAPSTVLARSLRVRIRPETLQVVHTVGDCRHAPFFGVHDYRVSNEFT
ncbi:hypothetical protein ALC62_02085 [Cyphomyrmex costatus]|uniref:Uncharacterized protein n=1 Tax=Cyphomyrmex costatus TaxID=456900 RepID=A0A151INC1_9HYME|nr:hypothetical protein ALC62_02085 [Cyphomyrmex costatus]